MKNINSANNRGFSLLELLLVVGVFSILAAYSAITFDNWFRDSIDRKVAKEIRFLHDAAKSYVKLNFETVMPPLGSIDEVEINDLKSQGFLKNDYRGITSHRQKLRIFIRHATDTAVNGSVVDVFTVTDNPDSGGVVRVSNNRLFNVAESNPELGLISSLTINSDCCDGNAQALSGLWSIPLSEFSAFYTATPNEDGGYVAAYGRVSTDSDILANYLYRVPINSIPQANTMEANLDMAGNDIVNTRVILSDSMNVTGNAVFQGNGNGAVNAPYVLATTSDVNFDQNASVQSANDQNGSVLITGDDTIGVDFTVADTLTVTVDGETNGGVISSGEMFVETINPMTISNFSNLNLNDTALNAGNIYVNSLQYANTINTVNMQTETIQNVSSITGANLVAERTIIENGSLNAPTDFEINNNIGIGGNADIGGQFNISDKAVIYNLRNCGGLCP